MIEKTVLEGMTSVELRALRDEIASILAEKREGDLALARELKAERAEKFTGKVSANDVVTVIFNKEEVAGLSVVRANEKTITVKINDKAKYIKYENVVSIDSEAENASDENEEVA